jgi:hypothetical protein
MIPHANKKDFLVDCTFTTSPFLLSIKFRVEWQLNFYSKLMNTPFRKNNLFRYCEKEFFLTVFSEIISLSNFAQLCSAAPVEQDSTRRQVTVVDGSWQKIENPERGDILPIFGPTANLVHPEILLSSEILRDL